MPVINRTQSWVSVFRDQINESTAKQFKVLDCRGKMRLQYRPAGGKAQSLMLPFDFRKQDTSKALRRIEQIYKNFIEAKGKKTLAKAAAITEVSSSKHEIPWDDLVAEFRPFIPNCGDETFKRNYYKTPKEISVSKRLKKKYSDEKLVLPVLNQAGLLMRRTKGKPVDGESLMMESLKHWKQGSRSRQIARRALQAFLNWAIPRGKLPAAYAPPATLPETTQPKEIGYPIRDQEILSLLESIKNEKWRFAIQLLSVYGLRPEELRYLTIKEGPTGKALYSTYKKSKGGTKGKKTESRRLNPLFIKDDEGNFIDWNLQARFEIGEALPCIGKTGEAGLYLGKFLKRNEYWNWLKQHVIETVKDEKLKPYCFRHRYAKESHAAGFPMVNIAESMGHTLEVHMLNYARFKPDKTAELYELRNKEKVAT